MISNNLNLVLLLSVFGIVAIIVLVKVFSYLLNKFFLDEFTLLMQRTIMRSYNVFKATGILIISIYLLVSLYCIFYAEYRSYGILLFSLTLYLIFTIYNDRKNGKLRLRETFDFQKHSTPVTFYNKQSESYRIKSYESVINRIQISDFTSIKEDELRSFLKIHFLQKIETLLTFEYYDAKLYHSISDHQTGTLFYSKFLKNVLEIISRINKQTDSLKELNGDYSYITDLLLDIKLIRFDDNQGLHYDITLIDLEIDKHLNLGNENFNLEKSLLVINQSLENLKLAFENNNLNYALSEQAEILCSLKEKLNTITIESKYLVYKLPENCTVKNVGDTLIDFFARKSTLEVFSKNNSDLLKFTTKRFKNNSNKQSSAPTKDYSDRQFFIENREDFYKAVSYTVSKFALEKKKLAEIIFEEFPDIGHSLKTIENRL